jgi:hypothetical protein
MQSPEHTPTPMATATYTAQFLRRRSSQQEIVAAREQQQHRITRRCSSEDASVPTEPLNGLASAKPQENGRQAGPAAAEKVPTDLQMNEKPAVAAASGKGAALNGGKLPTMGQDQNAVKRVAMVKKRRAPCGRSVVVLAVVAGVVTLSVAGGVLLCRMYPTSPAAAWICLAASRAEQELYTRLVELRGLAQPFTMEAGEVGRAKLLAVLRLGGLRLKKPAHALEELVQEWLTPSALAEVVKAAAMCLAVATDLQELLRLATVWLIDALESSVEWIQARVKHIIDSVEMSTDGEAFERARAFLLAAFSSLVEVLDHGLALTRSSLDHVFEWTGLESDVIDGTVPSESFLLPLAADQAAIQAVARKVTTEQSRALEDVQRFEKRRVTIASVANSVIADTRTIALDSIVEAKMVAAGFIEQRTQELAEQYAKALEQALEEFELTLKQVEEEGGSQAVAGVSRDTQAHMHTAARLKRDLLLLAKAMNEKLSATPDAQGEAHGSDLVTDDQQADELSETPSSPENDGANDENHLDVAVFAASEEVAIELEAEGGHGLDGEVQQTVVAQLVADLEGVVVEMEHTEVEVVKLSEGRGVFEVEVALQQEGRVGVHFQAPGEGTGEELPQVAEVVAAGAERLLPDVKTSIAALPGLGREEELTERMTGLTQQEDGSRVDGDAVPADIVEIEVPRDAQVDAEVRLDADEAETVLSELERIEEVELASVRSNVEAIEAATEVQTDDAVARDEAKQLKAEDREAVEDAIAAASSEIETLEMARAVVAHELEGLEQLDQALEEESELARVEEELEQLDEALQEEDKRVHEEDKTAQLDQTLEATSELARVAEELELLEQLEQALQEEDKLVHEEEEREQLSQIVQDEDKATRVQEELEQLEQAVQAEVGLGAAEEELRAIAEEEEVWMHSDQRSADRERTTAKIEETADAGRGWYASLAQAGLVAAVFLALAAYLLARYRKRARIGRAPPRRRRWKRLADLDESETEEVVLLPDSSDEEGDAAVAEPKERSLEVSELVASLTVATTTAKASSGGEEADVEEETSESHEVDEEELDEKEEGDSEPVSMSTRSHTVAAKSTTSTADHPATSSSDASADGGDNSSAPATPPPGSRLATPDTAERSRRRRRT